jgi:hypothetical protein
MVSHVCGCSCAAAAYKVVFLRKKKRHTENRLHSRLFLIGASFVALQLSACSLFVNSVTVRAQGIVQGSGEEFSGTATGYADGAGDLMVVSTKGTTCRGNYVFITQRQGEGVFTCSDGRSGPFEFVSTGRRGNGRGSLGAQTFVFTFGE